MKKKHKDINPDELLTLIRQVEADNACDIGHNDHFFLQRIYEGGLQKYVDRLKSIGFIGKQKVLDAGCGYGQWSLALAGLNATVESCDTCPLRVQFLNLLADQFGVTNLNTQVGGIDMMRHPDNYFDAIFCYSVIYFTDWKKSLAELARVLRPGGQLYVNTNGIGWYMFLWQEEHNKVDDYDPKAIAARCLSDTLLYDRQGIFEPGMQLIIEPQEIERELEGLGITQVQIAHEGRLHLNPSVPAPKPFFKEKYFGQLGAYEVVASKSR